MQPSGKLVLTREGEDEKEFALAKSEIVLGRAMNNDIVLRDPKISRTHARLEQTGDGYALVDLGAINGTRLNGTRVDHAELKPGDVIALGDTILRYEITPPRVEAEVTQIHSEADLEATLADATLPATVNETRVSRLVVHTAERTWEVPFVQDALTLGRASENDIPLGDPTVSHHHARVERHGDQFVVLDLDSRNGTYIAGARIEEQTLNEGDVIRIGEAQIVLKRAFVPADLTLVETLHNLVRPPVVFVPGLMGSELWCGSERRWPDVKLLFTQPELFQLPDNIGMEPRALVGEVVLVPNLIRFEQYNRLGDFLEDSLGYERGRDLFEFAYDWRYDVRESARHLGEAIEKWNIRAPITLIAHSLGCLVSRYYVERAGGKEHVGRLLVMGGPHAGAPRAMASLLLGSGLLPFGLLGERLRAVVATLPSMYQILPTYEVAIDQHGRAINVLEDASWLPDAHRALLHNAREFRAELGNHSSVPTVSIFGYGLKTVTSATVVRDPKGLWQKVDLGSDASGDTTIPEKSAVLPGSEIHPVQQYHGSLYVDNDVKMRLKLELTKT